MEFSILVVTHNQAAYLQRALRSIPAAAEGTTHEILVCDDGSTDATAALVRQLRPELSLLYYADPKAPTVAVARNRALARARGDWLVFLDGDDMLLPGHLSGLRAGNRPLTYGDYQLRDASGRTRLRQSEITRTGRQFPPLGCCLFRRTLVQQGFRFRPELQLGEDLDWFLQLRESGVPAHHINHPVYSKFETRDSLSARLPREVWEEYVFQRRPRR